MGEWHPIETARKDETRVLVWWGDAAFIAQWCWCDRRGEMSWEDEQGFGIDPTHWMPLPEPPTT